MGAFFRNRHALNSRQRSIARALIQTFVGTESEVEQAALDLAVDRCDDFLQSLAEPESAAPLRLLLNVIHAYVMVRFRCLPAALNADQRTLLVRDLCEPETTRLGRALELLNRRAGKPLPSGRDLVRALKQMCVLVYYSNPETGALTGYVPIWKRAHILAAAPELDAPPVRVPISQINAKHREGRGTPVERLFANDGRPKVAIVGSGAGGAVVAARLAATCDVAVFEAGPSFTASEYPLDTLSGMALLYRDGLMSFSKNLDLQVLAGRLVGGGTALTSGMSVKPRRRTLESWQRSGIDSGELGAGLDAVEQRLRLEPPEDDLLSDLGHLWRAENGCANDAIIERFDCTPRTIIQPKAHNGRFDNIKSGLQYRSHR